MTRHQLRLGIATEARTRPAAGRCGRAAGVACVCDGASLELGFPLASLMGGAPAGRAQFEESVVRIFLPSSAPLQPWSAIRG